MKSLNLFRGIIFFAVVIQWFLLVNISHAWPRYPYTDPQIVERAELIVVAHVKNDSLAFVYHKEDDHGYSYQYNATLVITEYIKGTSAQTDLPIIIHHGLVPYAFSENTRGKSRQFGAKSFEHGFEPSASIVLEDDGGEGGMIIDNIRTDQIWLLRHQQRKDRGYSGSDTTDEVGIWDPEDFQPAILKPYFAALLTDHPELLLKEYAVGNSPLAVKCTTFLNHLKIEEIVKEPDVEKRTKSLLPYCLYTDRSKAGASQMEALRKLADNCGLAGYDALMPIFENSKYEAMQEAVMNLWASAKYPKAVPLLIAALRKENRFWARQSTTAQNSMVNYHSEYHQTEKQNRSRVRIDNLLDDMKILQSVRTISILEETKRFWQRVAARGDSSDEYFLKKFDDALAYVQADQQSR